MKFQHLGLKILSSKERVGSSPTVRTRAEANLIADLTSQAVAMLLAGGRNFALTRPATIAFQAGAK